MISDSKLGLTFKVLHSEHLVSFNCVCDMILILDRHCTIVNDFLLPDPLPLDTDILVVSDLWLPVLALSVNKVMWLVPEEPLRIMIRVIFRKRTIRASWINLNNFINIVVLLFKHFIDLVPLEQEVFVILAYSWVSDLHLIDHLPCLSFHGLLIN